MSDAARIAAGVALVWLGMVLAISFLEAPLKFRAPGLELRVGLAIGRIVFRALNLAEVVWAIVVAVCLIVRAPSTGATTFGTIAIVALALQLSLVRPRLNRRSDRVLAGEDAPRSSAHHWYIALETIKTVALILFGAWLLSS